jgi:hypothetical protein
MTMQFSNNFFYLDKFGAKTNRGFRTQIDLNKRNNADQFWYGKDGACFPYPPKQSIGRTKKVDWRIWVRKARSERRRFFS